MTALKLSDMIGTMGRGSERDAASSQIKALFAGCREGVVGGVVEELVGGEEEGLTGLSRLCALAMSPSSPGKWAEGRGRGRVLGYLFYFLIEFNLIIIFPS